MQNLRLLSLILTFSLGACTHVPKTERIAKKHPTSQSSETSRNAEAGETSQPEHTQNPGVRDPQFERLLFDWRKNVDFQDGSRLTKIPAVTQTVTRRVVKTAATTTERNVPAIVRQETRRVLKTPAQVIERAVLARTEQVTRVDPVTGEMITETIITVPATVEYITAPAVYEMVSEPVITQEATTELVTVPATYQTITETTVKEPARLALLNADGSVARYIRSEADYQSALAGREVLSAPERAQSEISPSSISAAVTSPPMLAQCWDGSIVPAFVGCPGQPVSAAAPTPIIEPTAVMPAPEPLTWQPAPVVAAPPPSPAPVTPPPPLVLPMVPAAKILSWTALGARGAAIPEFKPVATPHVETLSYSEFAKNGETLKLIDIYGLIKTALKSDIASERYDSVDFKYGDNGFAILAEPERINSSGETLVNETDNKFRMGLQTYRPNSVKKYVQAYTTKPLRYRYIAFVVAKEDAVPVIAPSDSGAQMREDYNRGIPGSDLSNILGANEADDTNKYDFVPGYFCRIYIYDFAEIDSDKPYNLNSELEKHPRAHTLVKSQHQENSMIFSRLSELME